MEETLYYVQLLCTTGLYSEVDLIHYVNTVICVVESTLIQRWPFARVRLYVYSYDVMLESLDTENPSLNSYTPGPPSPLDPPMVLGSAYASYSLPLVPYFNWVLANMHL